VVQSVARSCEQAIGQGRCRVASELGPAAVVTWYALIRSAEGETTTLTIEFRDRSERGAVIETRDLSFAASDSEQSRWASAGAVIAAFVAARDPSSEPAPPPPPPVAPPPPAPSKPGESGPRFDLDLGLLSGPGLDTGAFRLGGVGRLYLSLPQAPRALGLVSLRYAERPGELSLSWWSASCGLGARLGGRGTPFSAELTGEVSFERMLMSATDAERDERDEAQQNRFGGRLSLNFALDLSEHVALVAGGEANALRPSVTIAVGENNVGRELPVRFGLSAGVRFSTGE
jgi:hypothetical protein